MQESVSTMAVVLFKGTDGAQRRRAGRVGEGEGGGSEARSTPARSEDLWSLGINKYTRTERINIRDYEGERGVECTEKKSGAS